jgi:rubrerythrin
MSEDLGPATAAGLDASPQDDNGGLTRAGLIKLLGAGAAGAAGLSLVFADPALAASSKKSTATDLTILQYALTLEYLGAAFYESALQNAHLTGDAQEIATTFRNQERQHVAFVQKTIKSLKGTPHAAQTFDFGSSTGSKDAFLKTAETIEMLCVETLNGAAPLVTTPVLKGAAELVSVEARHVSWVRAVLGQNAAPNAFTPVLTAAGSQAAVKKLGFVHGGLS